MVGKQGFIRTMEAVIAILMVLGFLLYVLPRQAVLAEPTIPEGLDSARNFILTEFSTNEEIRECIQTIGNGFDCSFGCGKDSIEPLLEKHKIPGFDYHCEICTVPSPCTDLYKAHPEAMKKSIYPGSVFIYYIGEATKYVRIYFWEV